MTGKEGCIEQGWEEQVRRIETGGCRAGASQEHRGWWGGDGTEQHAWKGHISLLRAEQQAWSRAHTESIGDELQP